MDDGMDEGIGAAATPTPSPTPSPRHLSVPHGAREPSVSEANAVATFAKRQFGDVPHAIKQIRPGVGSCARAKGKFRHPHVLRRPSLLQYWHEDPGGGERVLVRDTRERRASWTELFFDLAFVTVLGHLAVDLEHHPNARGLFEFATLFVASWRVWMAHAVLANRFGFDDAGYRAYLVALMLSVLGLAVHTRPAGVVVSYALARACIMGMSAYAAAYERRVRRATRLQAVVLLVSMVPWVASLFVGGGGDDDDRRPTVAQLSLWCAGVVADAAGMGALYGLVPGLDVPAAWELASERLGLFTILTMGEPIIALVFDDDAARAETYAASLSGFLTVFALFVVYFDVEANRQRRHALVAARRWRHVAWHCAHLPFQAAVVLQGVSYVLLIESTLEGGHAPYEFAKRLYAGSGALAWASLVAIGALHRGHTTVLVAKRARMAGRAAVAAAFLVLPLVAGDSVGAVMTALGCASIAASALDYYGGVPPPAQARHARRKRLFSVVKGGDGWLSVLRETNEAGEGEAGEGEGGEVEEEEVEEEEQEQQVEKQERSVSHEV